MDAFGIGLKGAMLTKHAVYSLDYTQEHGWTDSDWDSSELLDAIKSYNSKNAD